MICELIVMKIYYVYMAVFFLFLTNCNSKHQEIQPEKEEEYSYEKVTPKDSITIMKLIEYGMEGDLQRLASLFYYPIERDYPLPDIRDSVDFVRYTPIIWDDSLKLILRETRFEEWEPYGWRGYSFRNGYYFWVAGGKVIALTYDSSEEQQLWQELVQKEIGSLHPSLREDVERPYGIFKEKDGEWYGRIDMMKNEKYRLALYKDAYNPDLFPFFMAQDSVYKLEGSMANIYSVFVGDSLKVELFISDYVKSSMHIIKQEMEWDYDIYFDK